MNFQWLHLIVFTGSSDLIRRKSPDSVKEKRPQLSLSERLRMEFGLEDSEEEKDTEKGTGKYKYLKWLVIIQVVIRGNWYPK